MERCRIEIAVGKGELFNKVCSENCTGDNWVL